MKKLFTLFAIVGLFLPTLPLYTQGVDDLRCISKTECASSRAGLTGTADATGRTAADPGDAFLSAESRPDIADTCNGTKIYNPLGELDEVGFCLPISSAKTTIAFGGRRTFDSLADYIAFLYTYSLIIASVLATFMLVVAGIQWIGSGGNPSAIDGAKKRIANALTGLLILVTTYLILYTIDPNLTKLTQPDVYILRRITLSDPQCRAIEGNPPVAEARKIGDSSKKGAEAAFKAREELPASERPTTESSKCGYEYYFATGGEQMCKGHFCGNADGTVDRRAPQFCASDYSQNLAFEAIFPTCIPGSVGGNVFASNQFQRGGDWYARWAFGATGLDFFDAGEGYNYEWIDSVALYAVCSNGTVKEATSAHIGSSRINSNPTKVNQFFSLSIDTEKAVSQFNGWCKEAYAEGTNGFVLKIGFNEFSAVGAEYHLIGNQSGTGVDMGKYVSNRMLGPQCLLSNGKDKLITVKDLENGLNLEIDVSQVRDIDTDDLSNLLPKAAFDAIAGVGVGLINPIVGLFTFGSTADASAKAVVDEYTAEWESKYSFSFDECRRRLTTGS